MPLAQAAPVLILASPSRATPAHSPPLRMPTELPEVKTMGLSLVPLAMSWAPRETISARLVGREHVTLDDGARGDGQLGGGDHVDLLAEDVDRAVPGGVSGHVVVHQHLRRATRRDVAHWRHVAGIDAAATGATGAAAGPAGAAAGSAGAAAGPAGAAGPTAARGRVGAVVVVIITADAQAARQQGQQGGRRQPVPSLGTFHHLDLLFACSWYTRFCETAQ